ncbi:bifunctional adenosylcobinamide kinase/adenosylcobinamide-phosphate guanylyltransferase [Dethiobacter alkaliphilus]|uniref:Adenosylcobinamide kinase n=1 Tax=Dethiobacter alkaliphilus AHT 1 TaxID=555088 RepID=C0GDW2_DETAL|nr:bifunctional adenosylcobinamide kinase/adenosylcobinamide-phosphate guanylyltransferase [Dethiobacter alkaliphilus]EEG78256.1 Adenosylcobinamide-phosphate guanylyltransferase [Dethiobacter alkaliphilus AHT 1]
MKIDESEKLVLILGGARSGKSKLAEEIALTSGEAVAYIATAPVYDQEMAHRVKLHKERRPDHWFTVEEPRDLTAALAAVPAETKTVLLDCLTLWLTNVLLADYDEDMPSEKIDGIEETIREELSRFCVAARKKNIRILMVANEVGCGIVPESRLGRLFRDIAGRANQQVAKEADAVYLAVAGYPLQVKGGA